MSDDDIIGDDAVWLALVPPENNQKPNFMAMLQLVLQPFADMVAVSAALPGLFDLDDAVGSQLDIVGEWIGISRNVNVPLTGVYFSWDTAGRGWDEGAWQGPFDPDDGLVTLADPEYRFLLQAKIALNQWDGTIPGAQAIFSDLYPNRTVLILDGENNHMAFIMTSAPVSAVKAALFTGGYINPVPAGVQVDGYFIAPTLPIFGFDAENANISGWDVGTWLP